MRQDRLAVDPLLPLVAGPQFHQKADGGSLFHGAIADTEPDGWARQVILRDHAKRRQAKDRIGKAGGEVQAPSGALNHLDYLLAVDDSCRMGALRFRDEAGTLQREPEPGRRTAPPLIELSRLLASTRAVETHSETAADLAYLRGRGTSLGGLRPKCNVVDDDGSLSIGKSSGSTGSPPPRDRPPWPLVIAWAWLFTKRSLSTGSGRAMNGDG